MITDLNDKRQHLSTKVTGEQDTNQIEIQTKVSCTMLMVDKKQQFIYCEFIPLLACNTVSKRLDESNWSSTDCENIRKIQQTVYLIPSKIERKIQNLIFNNFKRWRNIRCRWHDQLIPATVAQHCNTIPHIWSNIWDYPITLRPTIFLIYPSTIPAKKPLDWYSMWRGRLV